MKIIVNCDCYRDSNRTCDITNGMCVITPPDSNVCLRRFETDKELIAFVNNNSIRKIQEIAIKINVLAPEEIDMKRIEEDVYDILTAYNPIDMNVEVEKI